VASPHADNDVGAFFSLALEAALGEKKPRR
jgi:hypothetical protein